MGLLKLNLFSIKTTIKYCFNTHLSILALVWNPVAIQYFSTDFVVLAAYDLYTKEKKYMHFVIP